MLAKCPDFTLVFCQDAIFVDGFCFVLNPLNPKPNRPETNTTQNHGSPSKLLLITSGAKDNGYFCYPYIFQFSFFFFFF